jgi:hypothetical protein
MGPKWQKKARELGVPEEDIAWHAKFGQLEKALMY